MGTKAALLEANASLIRSRQSQDHEAMADCLVNLYLNLIESISVHCISLVCPLELSIHHPCLQVGDRLPQVGIPACQLMHRAGGLCPDPEVTRQRRSEVNLSGWSCHEDFGQVAELPVLLFNTWSGRKRETTWLLSERGVQSMKSYQ